MHSDTYSAKKNIHFELESKKGKSQNIFKRYFDNNMQHADEKVVQKFKEKANEGPFFICHRCLYRRSVQYFESKFITRSIPNILYVFSFDVSSYFS